jgi:hypothetical protein
MPKRTRTERPDTVQNAHRVFLESIQGTEVNLSLVSQVMRQMGRKGGMIGGKRRLETLSDERRKQIASGAAKTRWERFRANKAEEAKRAEKRKTA